MTHESTSSKSKGKGGGVRVLHCLNPACNALLPFEVDDENVLLLDLRAFARHDGSTSYFPCPKCGGRNVVAIPEHGRPRVIGYEGGSPPASQSAPNESDDPLAWIPEAVRRKLNRIGIKLHLAQWQALPITERARLLELPCESEDDASQFRHYLENVAARCGVGELEALERK